MYSSSKIEGLSILIGGWKIRPKRGWDKISDYHDWFWLISCSICWDSIDYTDGSQHSVCVTGCVDGANVFVPSDIERVKLWPTLLTTVTVYTMMGTQHTIMFQITSASIWIVDSSACWLFCWIILLRFEIKQTCQWVKTLVVGFFDQS